MNIQSTLNPIILRGGKSINFNGNPDGVIKYKSLLASEVIDGNTFDDENFYPADGFSNLFEGFKKRQEKRIDRRDKTSLRKDALAKSKGDAKVIKAKAKLTDSKAKVIAAQSLTQQQEQIPMTMVAPVKEQPKLGTMGKIGIAVGVLSVIGIVAYLKFRN